jgi:uncharacterized membrane protein YfcA
VTTLAFVAAVSATSAVAGAAGAILGLGGGILLIPVLTLFYGVDLHYAMGASIVSVIATSSGAAAAYLRTSLSNIRIGLFLTLATVSGALVGAALGGILPVRGLELLLGLALGYSAYMTLRQLHVEIPPARDADRLALRFDLEGAYYDVPLGREVGYRATRVRGGFTAMFGAGVLSGLLGIGSGAFKVLAMDHCMRLPMKVSTATSNFMIGVTSAATAGVYFARGDIHPLLAAPVAIGVLVGASLGTRLLARLRNVTVRKVFLPVLAYLAISMIMRGLGIELP